MSYEIKVPALGESIVEATVARWLKRAGEAVAAGEAVVELETDKVNLEVASDQAGVIAAITKGEGDVVAVGDVLGSVSSGDAAVVAAPVAAPVATPAAAPVAAPTPTPDPRLPTPVTPVAHRVAAEHALDLSGVPGSGPGGRVTKEDVLKA
ncbi:dihydrolipoyllysine-residue succinyltransferase, partial [Chloroflexales bacterium ZM16-3]|nr:dihydrolipoyllysine-residue succinyltransferase [Chloroflexales bacterium ZM16-3]